MHCNPDFPADVIPVDTAINAIVTAAWDRGMNETKKIQYCNVSLPHEKQMTWGESVERGNLNEKKIFFFYCHYNVMLRVWKLISILPSDKITIEPKL